MRANRLGAPVLALRKSAAEKWSAWGCVSRIHWTLSPACSMCRRIALGACRRDRARPLVVIQHRIDDGAFPRQRIAHHILARPGAPVEECSDGGLGSGFGHAARISRNDKARTIARSGVREQEPHSLHALTWRISSQTYPIREGRRNLVRRTPNASTHVTASTSDVYRWRYAIRLRTVLPR